MQNILKMKNAEGKKSMIDATKVSKLLKLGRSLTECEQEYLNTWGVEYGYTFDVVELIAKRITGKTAPNFNFMNAVIRNWHEMGLHTIGQIEEYQANNELKRKPTEQRIDLLEKRVKELEDIIKLKL